jgi:hypothetical protein
VNRGTLLRLLRGAVPGLAVLVLALLAAPIVESQRGSPLTRWREFVPDDLRADEGRSVNELAPMQSDAPNTRCRCGRFC